MTLVDCASQIPDDPNLWPQLKLAKLPGAEVSWPFRKQLSGLFAGQDHIRLRAAERLGVGLRPYEPGDRPKEMSWPHFARTEEFWTKIDSQPGHAKAVFVLHLPSSMAYCGLSESVSKGRVAMAMAGILAQSHLSELHQIKTLVCTDDDLGTFVAQNERALRTAQWTWIFSDFFFEGCPDPTTVLNQFVENLRLLSRKNLGCFVVRDPSEQSSYAHLLQENTRSSATQNFPGTLLASFRDQKDLRKQKHLSATFWKNLEEQEELLKSLSKNIGMYFIDAHSSLDAILSQVSAFTQNPRR